MAPEKPRSGSPVDEWFKQHEEELLRQARRQRKRRAEEVMAQEASSLREAHWMKCPKCGNDLREERIEAVAIDRCDHCEGIFLDRGELEEILLGRSEDRRGFFRRLLGFGSE